MLRRVTRSRAFALLAMLLAGAAPWLVLTFGWKTAVGVPNDLVGAWSDGGWAHVLDPARYPLVAAAFGTSALRWAHGALLVLVALAVVSAARRLGRDARERAWRVIAAALAVLLAGYFLAFLTTPADQQWHLDTALPRLLAQLWPPFVLVCLLRIDARLLIPGLAANRVGVTGQIGSKR